MKKQSKQLISVIQRKLWEHCRRIANDIYSDSCGQVDCYTCEAKDLQGSNKQLGHVPWPKAVLGAYLKYDMRCLRWQCYHCNINCGGMGAEAYKRMLKEEGKKFMNQLEKDRNKDVKSYDYYLKLLKKYEKM